MSEKKLINAFARKWVTRLEDPELDTPRAEEEFWREYQMIGWEKSPETPQEVFPDALFETDRLYQATGLLDEESLLQAIAEKFRRVREGVESESLLAKVNRSWFLLALTQWLKLASKNGAFFFSAKIKEIEIDSFSRSVERALGDEVRQQVHLHDNGQIWFTSFRLRSQDGKTKLGRSERIQVEKEVMKEILSAFSEALSSEEGAAPCASSSWRLTLTDENNQKTTFEASSGIVSREQEVHLSELLRDAMQMEDLFLLDANQKEDRLERITVSYERVTPVTPQGLDEGVWNYSEHLRIDRASETMELIQKIGEGCVITYHFHVEDGVSNLLEGLDAQCLFSPMRKELPLDRKPSEELRRFHASADFALSGSHSISGIYDPAHLPEDWPVFAERVLEFMQFYGLGEMLNPSVYGGADHEADA